MRTILVILVLLLVLGGGAFGFLVYNGSIRLGAAKAAAPAPAAKPQVIPAGATLVPWNVRKIPANTLMTRELLIDPETGKIARQAINLDMLQGKGVITEPVQVVGRVLRVDMRPGYVFTESDFYPVGTQAGMTAAIPPGRRSVTIDVSKLSGARSLKPGDRVDLLASQSYDPSKKPAGMSLRTIGGGSDGASLAAYSVKQATVRVLAQDGVVVTPPTVRQVPITTPGGATSAAPMRTRPVEEIEIAVDPGEVPGLTEAIAEGADISCAVHSGQPEKAGTDKPLVAGNEQQDAQRIATVESIIGRRHEVLVVPTMRQGGQP